MPLIISDKILERAKLTEQEARIDIACHLFDDNRLSLNDAAEMGGVDRSEMKKILQERGIPIYRPTVEDVQHDVAALKKLGI